jgi:hypothetical protein
VYSLRMPCYELQPRANRYSDFFFYKKTAASVFNESKTLQTIKPWGGEFKIIAAKTSHLTKCTTVCNAVLNLCFHTATTTCFKLSYSEIPRRSRYRAEDEAQYTTNCGQ